MEGVDRCLCMTVWHQHVHAVLHLVRGAIRERQGEHLRGAGTFGGDEPGHAARDDLRLAGARSRDHEQRSLAVCHRSALIPVQTAQQLRDTFQGDRRAGFGRPRTGMLQPGRRKEGSIGCAHGTSLPVARATCVSRARGPH